MMTTDALLKSEKSGKYAITLPEPVVNNLISKIEGAILDIMVMEEAFQPELNQKREELRALEQKKEAFEQQKKIEETTLQGLIRLKTSDSSTKEVKMYRNLSNTIHKRSRSRDGNIPWTRTINELLTKRGEFMTEDEVYSAILEKHPDWAFKTDLLKKKYFRYYFRDNIIKGKLNQFTYYNNKFGLIHWMDGAIPKAKYLKQFMFGES